MLFKKKDFNELRKDFPILKREINNKPIIYLDNACMSLRPQQVLNTINDYYTSYPVCAGRSHHFLAEEVSSKILNARKKIADFFNAEEIIFTKNCTEAINLVANCFPFKQKDVVLTSDKEHNSNLVPWLKLQKEGKIKHDYIKSNSNNTFSVDNLEKKLEEHQGNVKLISIVHTSNLDGVTNPIQEIIKIAKKHNVKVLLDCAQSAMYKKINFKKLDADFIAVSSHKILGPNGVGALISNKKKLGLLKQFIVGGETVIDSNLNGTYQEEKLPAKFEAGLQNYPGILGFATAIDYLKKVGIKKIEKHLIELNKIISEGLTEIQEVKILGPPNPEERGSIISFVIKGKEVHETALLLSSTYNIMVRSGYHCVHSWFNKNNNDNKNVVNLNNNNNNNNYNNYNNDNNNDDISNYNNNNSRFSSGTIRVSLGLYNTKEEAQQFIEAIKQINKL